MSCVPAADEFRELATGSCSSTSELCSLFCFEALCGTQEAFFLPAESCHTCLVGTMALQCSLKPEPPHKNRCIKKMAIAEK